MRIPSQPFSVVVAIFFDARAEKLSFDFKDPRGVSQVAFAWMLRLNRSMGPRKESPGPLSSIQIILAPPEGNSLYH